MWTQPGFPGLQSTWLVKNSVGMSVIQEKTRPAALSLHDLGQHALRLPRSTPDAKLNNSGYPYARSHASAGH